MAHSAGETSAPLQGLTPPWSLTVAAVHAVQWLQAGEQVKVQQGQLVLVDRTGGGGQVHHSGRWLLPADGAAASATAATAVARWGGGVRGWVGVQGGDREKGEVGHAIRALQTLMACRYDAWVCAGVRTG